MREGRCLFGIQVIQHFLQQYAEVLAELLNLEITFVDEQCIRVAGTGRFQSGIGKQVPEGSFFQNILKTGRPGIIFDRHKDEQCSECIFLSICEEKATMGYPVRFQRKVIGVIGLSGFSQEQQVTIVQHSAKLNDFLSFVGKFIEIKLLLSQQSQTDEQREDRLTFAHLIGQNEDFLHVLEKAKQVALSPSTVFITGESGTGKEMIAQALHHERGDDSAPFVAVNCAAIPENLLESELFGYEGGSFTGALREGKIGKFEQAHHGTLFLDEIGDMPLVLQAKILRAIQEKKITRVGGQVPIPINIRIIAATNKDLPELIAQGLFREDLFYRLYVIPLHIPSLRERREDILLLSNYFIQKFTQVLNKPIFELDIHVKRIFLAYDWPGNIRQLENAIEYIANMTQGKLATERELPDYLLDHKDSKFSSSGLVDVLEAYEKNFLKTLLQDNDVEDKEELAKSLQISLSTLYRKMDKYQL